MALLQNFIDGGKKVFIFLGEAGSGKSEIAVNLALELASEGKKVRLFDMDQTKATFRSRELNNLLQENGVTVEYGDQLLDTPTVPDAVLDKIKEVDFFTVMDIGGNVAGAINIGQFAGDFGIEVVPFIVINPYRPFSDNYTDMLCTINDILMAAGLKKATVVSNPNFGEETTLNDVVTGYRNLKDFLIHTQYNIEFLVVPKTLEIITKATFTDTPVLGITRYIKAPWE